jgi:peroxiredoxin
VREGITLQAIANWRWGTKLQLKQIPEDDGSCEHLVGVRLPDIALPGTDGISVNLSRLKGTTVVYCYPMTSQPDVLPPDGWDEIPGARGCTSQSCSFRDHFSELLELNASVYGLSTQNTYYQKEMAERLHLPFSVISDAKFEFCDTLNIPTFIADGKRLTKRVTIIIDLGVIEAVHYPIFPSNSDPDWVISYLSS